MTGMKGLKRGGKGEKVWEIPPKKDGCRIDGCHVCLNDMPSNINSELGVFHSMLDQSWIWTL